jgi:hypothetical protein
VDENIFSFILWSQEMIAIFSHCICQNKYPSNSLAIKRHPPVGGMKESSGGGKFKNDIFDIF